MSRAAAGHGHRDAGAALAELVLRAAEGGPAGKGVR